MESKNNIYFTSDTHFGHKNIIRFCNRPFENTHQMNKILTENWNSTVGEEDIIYQLGDFAFGNFNHYIHRLKGRKISIRGNHDRMKEVKKLGEWYDRLSFTYDGIKFLLNHRPILDDDVDDVYRDSDRFIKADGIEDYDWIICGHVHEKWKIMGKNINVGVDVWDYKPVSIEQILELIKSVST